MDATDLASTIGFGVGESRFAASSILHHPRFPHAKSSRIEPFSCLHGPASTKK